MLQVERKKGTLELITEPYISKHTYMLPVKKQKKLNSDEHTYIAPKFS